MNENIDSYHHPKMGAIVYAWDSVDISGDSLQQVIVIIQNIFIIIIVLIPIVIFFVIIIKIIFIFTFIFVFIYLLIFIFIVTLSSPSS